MSLPRHFLPNLPRSHSGIAFDVLTPSHLWGDGSGEGNQGANLFRTTVIPSPGGLRPPTSPQRGEVQNPNPLKRDSSALAGEEGVGPANSTSRTCIKLLLTTDLENLMR